MTTQIQSPNIASGAVTVEKISIVGISEGGVTTATNLADGAANQIAYQQAAGDTGFITAPTTATTYLQWNGSAFTWASSVGPQGPTGPSGANGTIGVNGSTGPQGPQGPSGASVTGPQGPQGPAGSSITGPQGPQGPSNIYAVSGQANTSTSFLGLPAGTTAQRPGSPANGYMRFNTTTGYGEVYNASVAQWLQFGTAPLISVEYLVVAGGGGGGTHSGGGGGGGGLLTGNFTDLSLNYGYTITVGSGGPGALGNYPSPSSAGGSSGSNSTFNSITCAGGGGGGHVYGPGLNGGSGGGGSRDQLYGNGNTPATTPSQGNRGGYPNLSSGTANYPGGGGGGAGAVGGAGDATNGGAGGAGAQNSITGTSVYYAGGGGGNIQQGPGSGGAGGTGGGGYGATTSGLGQNGGTNLGGGGGGGQYNGGSGTSGFQGNGGSGIVIIKYLSSYNASFSAGLTVSTATASGYKISSVTAGTGTVTFTMG